MNKIFLDADVILDLLLDRKPFSDDIAAIIENSIYQSTKVCVSSITISNLHYIIGRLENNRNAKKKTKKILELVYVENVGNSTIRKVIESKFKDFEDAIQNFCAEEAKHKILITRNTKDYKESDLAILTPNEYLAIIK